MIRHDTSERHQGKYNNTNPLHVFALHRFWERLAGLIRVIEPSSILEFGCGEGLLLRELKSRGVSFERYLGIDIRRDAIAYARKLHPESEFLIQDILTWDSDETFDLVICSQVLEHLAAPGDYLPSLAKRSSNRILLTVPREPFFQLTNLLRGRDLRRLGNHPEHVNRWTTEQFAQFVDQELDVVLLETSFPFTICIARRRSQF